VQRRDQEALHQALSNPQAELPYIHQKWSETYLHALVEEERARMPTSILCLYRGLNRETSEELMERMTPGAFLLRQAPHEKIVFSFRNQAGIKHWKMIERERKFYMSFNNPSESYDSIGELLELQYEAIIEFDCDTVDSLPSPLLSQQDSKTDEDHDGYETIPEVQLESLPGAPVADLPCAKNGVYALVYLSKTKPKVPTLKDGALFVINMAVQRRDQEALHQALSNPQAELPYIHQKWSETYLHALVEEERARMPTSILCLYRGLNRETSEELMERMTPGAFLLRQAPHEKIVFSFRNQAGIKHWKMIERERKFYMSFNNPSESYDSIGELLEHFIPLLEAKTRVPVHIGTCPDLHLVGWERVPILKELSKEESHLTHEQITSVVNSVNGRIQKERVGSMEVANTREMDAVDWNDRMILNVTRMGADLLLTKHGRPGNFIVRPSLSSTNDFAIGFKTVQDICHWKVTRLDGHFIIKPRPHKYNSLNQVINAFVHQVQEVTGIEKWEHLSVPQETVELLLDYSLVNKKEKKVTKQEDHLRYPHLAGRSEWREEEEEVNPANEAKRYSWAFCQLSQDDDLSIVGPWTMSKENGHTPHTPLVAEANVEPRFYSLERMRKRGNYTKRLREVQPILDSEPCNRTSLSQLNPANVASWSRDDVAQWLIDNNLQKFVDVFKTNEVDGECLLSLDHTQLKEDLGIAALGHRHKIMKLIRKLGGQNAPPRFGQTPPNTPS
jgi:hypothetical protein